MPRKMPIRFMPSGVRGPKGAICPKPNMIRRQIQVCTQYIGEEPPAGAALAAAFPDMVFPLGLSASSPNCPVSLRQCSNGRLGKIYLARTLFGQTEKNNILFDFFKQPHSEAVFT